MADTDWNLHSKQLITPTDNDRMLVEPSDETAKAVEVGGFRNWLMNTAIFNTLTTTTKNIIGAIEEVKGIADSNTTQLNANTQNISNIKTKITATEGTFQPIIEGTDTQGVNEYSVREGKYKLINGICYFTIRLNLTALASGNTGYTKISSLPYACSQVINFTVNKCYPCKTTKQIIPRLTDGNTIWLCEVNDLNQNGAVPIIELYNNTEIEISGSYFI